MKIERFEDLHAWQEARKLVGLAYQVTRREIFSSDRDLVRHIRRTAVSIMANIAEGFARYSVKNSKQFFITARGSVAELRSHFYVAFDQGYLSSDDLKAIHAQGDVVGKLVNGLIRNAKKQLAAPASLKTTSEPMNQ